MLIARLQTAHNLYLCFDLCTGGELFDRICAKGNYYEECVAPRAVLADLASCSCVLLGTQRRSCAPSWARSSTSTSAGSSTAVSAPVSWAPVRAYRSFVHPLTCAPDTAHCTDLKPENLLFRTKDEDADIMIADFGLSRVMDDEKFHLLTEICGTPGVRAPRLSLRAL